MTRGAALDVQGTLIKNDPVLVIPLQPTENDLNLATLVRELAPMADIPFRELTENIRSTRYYPVGLIAKTLFYEKEEEIREYFDRHINYPKSRS